MGVDVLDQGAPGVFGPWCAPKQEKVSEIYNGSVKLVSSPSGYLWGHL